MLDVLLVDLRIFDLWVPAWLLAILSWLFSALLAARLFSGNLAHLVLGEAFVVKRLCLIAANPEAGHALNVRVIVTPAIVFGKGPVKIAAWSVS